MFRRNHNTSNGVNTTTIHKPGGGGEVSNTGDGKLSGGIGSSNSAGECTSSNSSGPIHLVPSSQSVSLTSSTSLQPEFIVCSSNSSILDTNINSSGVTNSTSSTTAKSNNSSSSYHHHRPSPNSNNKYHMTKSGSKRRRQRCWWWSSPPPTTTTTSLSSSLFYPNSKNIVVILLVIQVLLAGIIYIQYVTIRTKDVTILTILTHHTTTSGGGDGSRSGRNNINDKNIAMRNLFNSKQYKLFLSFQQQQQQQQRTDCDSAMVTTTTTNSGGVGVFPRRKPPVTTAQQQAQAPKPWIPYSSIILPKLSYPIFVPSLPKSGTTSIWKYFKCGYQESCHNWIQKPGFGVKSTLLGKCIEENIRNAQPPFTNCGPYDVYTDTGYLNYDHDVGEQCFYPSIDGLDSIYESYPNITFVNVVRNTESWYNSIKGWSQASLFVRLRLCNATGFPNGQSTKQDIMQMYDNFNIMIRQFVADRPSITYIEVQLESNDTGRLLEEATGIDSSCWKVCKPQERHCEGDHPKKYHAAKAAAAGGGQPQQQPSHQQSTNQHQQNIHSVNQEVARTNEEEEGGGGNDERNGGDDDEGLGPS